MEAAAVSYPGFEADIGGSAGRRGRFLANVPRGPQAALRASCPARRVRAMVVAIDGPAGAGKSSVARRLADKVGFTYLDSGAMYRAVGARSLAARSRRPRGAPASPRSSWATGSALDGADVT